MCGYMCVSVDSTHAPNTLLGEYENNKSHDPQIKRVDNENFIIIPNTSWLYSGNDGVCVY